VRWSYIDSEEFAFFKADPMKICGFEKDLPFSVWVVFFRSGGLFLIPKVPKSSLVGCVGLKFNFWKSTFVKLRKEPTVFRYLQAYGKLGPALLSNRSLSCKMSWFFIILL
jgi:hypothetical protein